MKNLLALALVLGLASVANAHFIFTVDGEEQPPGIEMAPPIIVELGLELSAGEKILGYTLDYKLSSADVEFDVSKIEFPMEFVFIPSAIFVFSPQHVQIAGSNIIGGPISGPAVIMQKLYLHCLVKYPNAVLEIVVTGTTQIGPTGFEPPLPIGEVLHTLIVHPIPEPATMLLLGLGGLLLRRRR